MCISNMADKETKQCSICHENTKYSCVICEKPVCNRSSECSMPAEEHLQREFESVSYCRNCKIPDAPQSSREEFEEAKKDSVSPVNFPEQNTNDSDWKPDSDGDDSDVVNETLNLAGTGKKRKRGKKCQWDSDDLDNFVDIIINDENHKRKLIFQNTKSKSNKSNYEAIKKELKKRAEKRGAVFEKSVTQMRNKFKKLVTECKKANMVFKTATGISNYKDQKDFSSWFDMLFPLIKSRESCQPEQAIEPSAGPSTSDKESEINVFDDESETGTSTKSDEKLFVPKPTKKNKKGENSLVEKTVEVLESVKSLVQNQQTSSFLEFMEKENARARAHELEILKLLMPPAQTQVQGNFEATSASSVPQPWQPYGHVGISSHFGNYLPNSQQPVNPICANISSSIPVRPLSNPQTIFSQQSGGLSQNNMPEYFEL